MSWRLRHRPPADFIEPCLPIAALRAPAGDVWLHEIKHDGYRMMARRDDKGVRLYTRHGFNWTSRFPLMVAAIGLLPVRSCLIDGDAVVCDDRGIANFELLQSREHDNRVCLYAFDLIEVNGADLRREPIEDRKQILAQLVRKEHNGIRANGHLDGDGEKVFHHACKMNVHGIVSKRRGSPYRSGRSYDWIVSRNPENASGRREDDEDWEE
ncbi:MAG: hypothetical protein QOC56_561 [Alphaproteobacteria bacterium]|nr:hypothetical protein [Alphaproteobacteria bacterium]